MGPLTVGGRQLLATGSDDEPVWLWDLTTSQQTTGLEGRRSGVITVCPVTVGGRQLLATASYDRTVRLRDPPRASRP